MSEMSDEDFARLERAIALARYCLALAVEVDDDLSAYHLKQALHSLHFTLQIAAEGRDDRGTVTLTVYEAQKARSVTVGPRKSRTPDDRL